MLQRIQTVYLLLVICCFIVLMVAPLYHIQSNDGVYSLTIIKTSFIRPTKILVLNYNFSLIVSSLLIVIISVATIFRYKQRTIQLKLINILFFLVLIFTGLLFFDYRQLIGLSAIANANSISVLVIIVPIVMLLLLLARNGIKKDEALVRSADRLR